MGVIGLFCVAGIPLGASAQERPGRARNQSLQDQIKPLDVRTNDARAPTASAPKTNDVETGMTQKNSRPVVIEGPGYNRGLSATPR